MNRKQSIIDTLKVIIKKSAIEAGYAPTGDYLERFIMSLSKAKAKTPHDLELLDRSAAPLLSWQFMHKSKVILFSTEQVDVFAKMRKSPLDAVDYKLPFDSIFIQFTKPYRRILQPDDIGESDVFGMLLVQESVERETHAQLVADGMLGFMSFEDTHSAYWNRLFVFAQYRDVAIMSSMTWQSDVIHRDVSNGDDTHGFWRDIAIACIGYINCENVYLEKQGEVPEAVNRKREAKGKSRLEPYYVCRIKGVQYDSHATGEGSKHGIRYDVRGHFRRLLTGKTLWVRPHQRGLANELYIPKVYKVEKGSKG